MKKEKIIVKMQSKVVEMTPKRAKKARKMIEANEMIDWSKPLQVVESEIVKVLTSGKHKQLAFSGMIISETNKGDYQSNWQKSDFKLCKDQTVKFD